MEEHVVAVRQHVAVNTSANHTVVRCHVSLTAKAVGRSGYEPPLTNSSTAPSRHTHALTRKPDAKPKHPRTCGGSAPGSCWWHKAEVISGGPANGGGSGGQGCKALSTGIIR
jgi:hypothetical protein